MSAGTPPFAERHYSIRELAEAWNISADLVKDLVKDEPDIVEIFKPKPDTRLYKTRRIPQSVAERVYRRFKKH